MLAEGQRLDTPVFAQHRVRRTWLRRWRGKEGSLPGRRPLFLILETHLSSHSLRMQGAADMDEALASNIMKKARFRADDLNADDEYDFDRGIDMYEKKKGDQARSLYPHNGLTSCAGGFLPLHSFVTHPHTATALLGAPCHSWSTMRQSSGTPLQTITWRFGRPPAPC